MGGGELHPSTRPQLSAPGPPIRPPDHHQMLSASLRIAVFFPRFPALQRGFEWSDFLDSIKEDPPVLGFQFSPTNFKQVRYRPPEFLYTT